MSEVVTRIGTDAVNGAFYVQSVQDCTDLLGKCRDERAVDVLRNYRKAKAFRCLAELPAALVEDLKAQGMDICTDREALRRVLNDPAFAAFRCSTGRI